jgi:hypothetical protein
MDRIQLLFTAGLVPLLFVASDVKSAPRTGDQQDQATQAPAAPQSGARRSADASEQDRTAKTETFAGVLLDANCATLAGSGKAPGRATVSEGDGTGGAANGVTGSGGSAGNPNAAKPQTSGEAARKATASTPETRSRESASQSGPDRASATTGTTGAGSGPAEANPAAAAAADRKSGQPSSHAMAGEYQGCSPTRSTTAFSVYASGRHLKLDPASNRMVRRQFFGDGEGSADRSRMESPVLHVEVTGTMHNGELRVASVKRTGASKP